MIQIAKYGSMSLIAGGVYISKLLGAVIVDDGDVVRLTFDGAKIIARPYTEFTDKQGNYFASAQAVKDYVDKISGANRKFKIQTVADENVTDKDHRSINYVTELKDGVRLHKRYTIDEVTGFLQATDYYKDFDGVNLTNQILRVEEAYQVDPDETIINAKDAVSRVKVRKYTKEEDGQIDEDTDTQKTTEKFYTEKGQIRKEGQRRRHNVQLILEERIGLVLMLTGQAAIIEQVYEILVEFFQSHNAAINAWLESGRGAVYDDITNDISHAWLNTVIPNTPETQALLPNSIGETLRGFIVERLKGNK